MKNMYNVKLNKTNSMKFIFLKNKICTNIKKRVVCKLKRGCQRYFWKLVMLYFILRSQKTRSLGFPQELCLVLLTVGTILDHLTVKRILPAALQVPATPFWPFPYWSLFPKPSPLRHMHGSCPYFPCTATETSQVKKPTLSTPLPQHSPAHFQNHSPGNSVTVNRCCPLERIWDHLIVLRNVG